MVVLKFGGTSVGSASRMKEVAKILLDTKGEKVVVLSAVSGTTNALVEITQLFKDGETKRVQNCISELRAKYDLLIEELYENAVDRTEAQTHVQRHFKELQKLTSQPYYDQIPKIIVVMGELISTKLFSLYLTSIAVKNELLSALDFMYLNEMGDPDIETIRTRLSQILAKREDCDLFITQGFLCRNVHGGTDNLKRGGSDYSATLIGAALKSDEVQIWTDIDGMHNNDPRVVNQTRPISKLSFEEASELAYFGAKILHPHCIIPAHFHNVPVRIKNTMKPDAHGTLISSETNPTGVKAIAAKSDITAVKIKSSRMIMAYGFLRKVFEVFEKFQTPIDMITTSEVAISLTIDDQTYLEDIHQEILTFGKVEIDRDQTIICIVGDMVAENRGLGSEILKALHDVPIRMISYGGSKNNISLLIDTQYKSEALNLLNDELFDFK